MDLGLAGKVVIVTGAASGMGRAVAWLFASEGGELGIGVRLAAESVVDKDQSLRSFMRCLLYCL